MRDDYPNTENLAQTVAREARRPIDIRELDGRHLFAVPEGFTLETDEALLKLQPAPLRPTGKVHLQTLDSFIDYLLKHRGVGTTVWCQANYVAGTVDFIAVLNDHEPSAEQDAPGWRDFRATFKPAYSVEWSRWTKSNREKMSQVEFATFIDDNLKDIAPPEEGLPSGTQMLQMASCIEISQDKRIKSAVRLQSGGIQVEYVENDDAATVERMQLFERFRLGIPVFWQGAAYKLDARLRYKHSEAKLALWYELVRPDKLVEDAIGEMVAIIEERLELAVLFGSPDA
ncbi:MAG: DUF2303 family protein [Alcaligenaceae bacterium]|nr:DUF2303 family protein [Alcaligenaceae bacterium SAGV5]MPS51237.1 DUF2303 family protein [Alcaligenaceae bacterium SAGV3]MPT57266.1 DUF2303 family protein [Alcaligenaceae bacterium]